MAAWVPEEGHRLVHVAPALTFPLSFQPQHSHLVIQQLLGHLDANSKSAATVRAGIVEVLSEAAVIAASGSVGRCTDPSSPSILLPVSFGGRCGELLEVWCAPGCEPVLGGSGPERRGELGIRWVPFQRTRAQHPRTAGFRWLSAMPALASTQGGKGIFRALFLGLTPNTPS